MQISHAEGYSHPQAWFNVLLALPQGSPRVQLRLRLPAGPALLSGTHRDRSSASEVSNDRMRIQLLLRLTKISPCRVYDGPEYVQCRNDEILTALGTNRVNLFFLGLAVSSSGCVYSQHLISPHRHRQVAYGLWQVGRIWHNVNPFHMLAIGIAFTAFQERANLTKRSKHLKTA